MEIKIVLDMTPACAAVLDRLTAAIAENAEMIDASMKIATKAAKQAKEAKTETVKEFRGPGAGAYKVADSGDAPGASGGADAGAGDDAPSESTDTAGAGGGSAPVGEGDGAAPEVKLETVRAELLRINRAGKKARTKELLKKYGAEALSEVKPADYAALYAEAKAE